MKRQVEVFTANCPVCDPVVKMIEELACGECEITTYDLVKQCDDKTCLTKMNEYGVQKYQRWPLTENCWIAVRIRPLPRKN